MSTSDFITTDIITGDFTPKASLTINPLIYSGGTATVTFPDMDLGKTERLAKRVDELEKHIVDLIDIVDHLRAELYDA